MTTVQQGAYREGMDAGLDRAAELLHARARVLICGRKRTNQVDRHTSEVLCRARDDILKLKTGK